MSYRGTKTPPGERDFLRPDGTEMKGNNRGTCIAIWEAGVHGCRRWWVKRDELIKKYST